MKNLRILSVTVIVVCIAGFAQAAPNCIKGKLCGNTCITKTDVCHKTGTVSAKHCSKGKPCGNSCIARNKVCHK